MILWLTLACTGEAEEGEVPDASDDKQSGEQFGDSADDSGSGRDSDDTGPDDGCDVQVESTLPSQGAVDVYYRSIIEFHLNQRHLDATFTADFPGVTTMLEGGEIWTYTPDPPLAPNTTYTISLDICSDETWLEFTTSELGSNPVEPLDLIGNPFLVAFDDARFVKPPDVGSILQQYLSGLYLVPTAQDEHSIIMFGATTLADSDLQAYCAPTAHLPEGTFDEFGYFALGGGETHTLQVSGIDVDISNLTIEGSFAPDGSYFGGGRMTGMIDTRPLDTLVDEEAEEGYICDLAVGLGMMCVPCPDGESYCMEIEIDQLVGNAEFTDVVEIAGTNCLGCLDGPPPDVSETCEVDPDAEASGATCAAVPAWSTLTWAGVLAVFGRRMRRRQ